MIDGMATVRITEAELARDVRAALEKVERGNEVIIEREDHRPVAVMSPPQPVGRKISECIALLPEDSTATIDPDFSRDVEAAIAAHREALEPPAWD